MADDNKLKSLGYIFNGTTLFRIPDYQRGFSWQKDQLEDFWDDLKNLHGKKEHYTGLLTLQKLNGDKEIDKALSDDEKWFNEEGEGISVYHVVDGQQRLTTAVILINEILNFLAEHNEKNISMQTSCADAKTKFIVRFGTDENYMVHMFGYAKDDPSFNCLRYEIFKSLEDPRDSEVIKNSQTLYTKNLLYAKNFFAKKLNELGGVDAVKELYKKLTVRFKFMIHDINSEYDVYVAFETMNNRGKPLSTLELLKNRLIYLTTLFSDNSDYLRNKINDAWKSVYKWLGKNESKALDDDDFLRTHWIACYQTPQKKANEIMNSLLKEKFTPKNIYAANNPLTPTEVKEYAKSIQKFVEYYYFIYYPDEYNKFTHEVKNLIKRINQLGIGFFKPLIMVAISKNLDAAKLAELLKAIERFIMVRFKFGSSRTDKGGSVYYDYAKKLNYDEVTADEIIKKINDDVEDDMQLSMKNFVATISDLFGRAKLKEKGYYGWSELKYVLSVYEYNLRLPTDSGFALDWDKLFTQKNSTLSIEHILPQTPNEDWKEIFAAYIADEKKMDALTNALGNLLVLPKPINSELSNAVFKKKRERYKQGTLSEIKVGNIEGDWTAAEIKKRTEKLLDFMIDYWQLAIDDDQRKNLINLDFMDNVN